jgi:hypothetical protein
MIPIGTLQRLSGHEHVDLERVSPKDYPPSEIIQNIIAACSTCRALADAFQEGREVGYAEGWNEAMDEAAN